MESGELLPTAMNFAAASRSTFLDKASSLLATASPAVSAELRSSLNIDPAYSKDGSQDGVCTCNSCGTIFLPGWNSSILRRTTGPRSRQDRLAKTTSKGVNFQCSQCNAITTIESTKPIRAIPRKATSNKPSPSAKSHHAAEDRQRDLTTPKAIVPASTEPGPRKRSRNNKKSSLQSLLADRNSSKQKTSSLDIMDFMKT